MGVRLVADQPVAARPPAAAGVAILGIEVVQSVQTLANDVPLIRGKPTMVRVYLQPSGLAPTTLLRGEIAVGPTATAAVKFVASNTIIIPATPYPDLATQRRTLTASLNFLLPPDVVAWPTLSITTSRITVGDVGLPLSPNPRVEVALGTTPPLRVKAIGLRYAINDPGGGPPAQFRPTEIHFDLLFSFLRRAYPVAVVQFSQLTVQADPRIAPPFSGTPTPDGDDPVWRAQLDIAHNQLAAIRAKDIDAGTDPRTHYYGMISDANRGLFFRGAAKSLPVTPNPAVVAVGPAGDPKQFSSLAWDTDASYGDWYGAHELGHTFGRPHPGFCNQDAGDPTFPYADGRIGDAREDAIGIDFGEPLFQIRMALKTNEVCHDVMTYCDNVWLSAYTYKAILARLIAEDAAFAPATS